MNMDAVDTVSADPGTLRDELTDLNPENPALARLQRDLAAGGSAEQVITSYDRMHHRHNRS